MKNHAPHSFDPFCATPHYLAFDSLPDDLQALDRYLLHVLVSFADRGEAHSTRIESLAVTPGLKRLAGRSSLNDRTVQRSLDRLAGRRLVLIVEHKEQGAGSRSNTYVITPKAFVLYALKLALAACEDLGPMHSSLELQRIGAISRRVQQELSSLDRLPGRTTRDGLKAYKRIFAELNQRILDFQNRSIEDVVMGSVDLNHDSGPGGGMAQSPPIKILKNPDLKFSEIVSRTKYVKHEESILILSFKRNNKKINKNEWMVSKSARACGIDEPRLSVNTEGTDSPAITAQVVSIAKDFQQRFGSRNGFLDWNLLNRWVATILSEKGLDYTLKLAAWTDQLWASRGGRPIRLSPASLKTLAQMFESEQVKLQPKNLISASNHDHSYSSDNSIGEKTLRCEATTKNIITESCPTISEVKSDPIQ